MIESEVAKTRRCEIPRNKTLRDDISQYPEIADKKREPPHIFCAGAMLRGRHVVIISGLHADSRAQLLAHSARRFIAAQMGAGVLAARISS